MFKILIKSQYFRQPKLISTKMDYNFIQCFKYKSHYSSLGLDNNASPQDIKSAYYNLSLRFHPDKNNGSMESVEKFREITAAYEVLGNAEKKKIYDQDLSSGYSEAAWRRENYSARSDQSGRRPPPRTGRSPHYNYDEHFKQHYDEYNKQRQNDYEYFRQRWEAEYRRRYPFSDERQWSRYQRPVTSEDRLKWRALYTKTSFVYFMTFWFLLLLVILPSAEYLEEKSKRPFKTVYYKVNSEDETPSDK